MTDVVPATDAWNPADECLAHVAAPRIIGGPSHHHVCRRPSGHRTDDNQAQDHAHVCGCGATW